MDLQVLTGVQETLKRLYDNTDNDKIENMALYEVLLNLGVLIDYEKHIQNKR